MKKVAHIFLGIVALILIVVAAAIGRSFVAGVKNPPLETGRAILGGEIFRVELARTVGERALGLSGRGDLGERDGMLFIFGAPAVHRFWMKDMLFPIDIIWINGGRIIGFAENAQPEPGKRVWELAVYSPPEPAGMVLEVRAGTVARLGVNVGDNLEISL